MALGPHEIFATVPPDMPIDGEQAGLTIRQDRLFVYVNDELVAGRSSLMEKPYQQSRLADGCTGFCAGAVFSALPMMTVVNYSVQDSLGQNQFFWNGDGWFRDLLNPSTEIGARFAMRCLRNLSFSVVALLIEIPLGIAIALCLPRSGWAVGPLLVIIALPMLIPWNVVGTIWQIFSREDIGLFGAALTGLGLHYNVTQEPISAWCTIVVIDVWHWTPLVILLSLCRPAGHPRRLLPSGAHRCREPMGNVHQYRIA